MANVIGNWNYSLSKKRAPMSYIVKTIAADDLATQGAKELLVQ